MEENIIKWKKFNEMLEGHLCGIKKILDDRVYLYAPDISYDVEIVYDVNKDILLFVCVSKQKTLIQLEGDYLNECTLGQYLIEYCGK